jgi:hypothetical protein
MKKFLSMLLVAGMATFVACGPSAKEKAEKEKAKQDSIAMAEKQKKMQDSIAMVEKAKKVQDSIAMVEKKKKMEDSLAMVAKKGHKKAAKKAEGTKTETKKGGKKRMPTPGAK